MQPKLDTISRVLREQITGVREARVIVREPEDTTRSERIAEVLETSSSVVPLKADGDSGTADLVELRRVDHRCPGLDVAM